MKSSYTLEQLRFIRRFRWLYSDEAALETNYSERMKQLRDMAREATEWVSAEHRERFSLFAQGQNIKIGDEIKSAQYLASLFSCTPSYDRLLILYPDLYEIPFTFCVPVAWVEIIDNLSEEISTLLSQHPGTLIEVSDVKEKFGQLRFYYSLLGSEQTLDQVDQKIEALIEQANQQIQHSEHSKR